MELTGGKQIEAKQLDVANVAATVILGGACRDGEGDRQGVGGRARGIG